MAKNKIKSKKEKTNLHPNNKHNSFYDFEKLSSCYPNLKNYIIENEYNNLTIDFFNAEAVRALNKALLITYYEIEYWDFPTNYLCPPIPGRADYIHYMNDLLNENKLAENKEIKCFDIGTGANCIYPIIGVKEYNWNFVGSEIDRIAYESAKKIIENNKILKEKVELKFQINSNQIFRSLIEESDYYDLCICNPPFHKSAEAAKLANTNKLSNLKNQKISQSDLNFGGQSNELWYLGGEERFVSNIITESLEFNKNFGWFTTLVSKKSILEIALRQFKKHEIKDFKIINMSQGNKTSRVLCWRIS